MEAERALYSRYRLVFYGGLALVLVFAAVFGFVSGARDGSLRPVVFGVLGLLVAAGFSRGARLRVVLRGDFLEIVNPLRTYRIAWSDVGRVEPYVFYGWKIRVLVNGGSRVAYGLSEFNRYRRGFDPRYDAFDRDAPVWMVEGCADLQRYLQARRASAGSAR